MSPGRGDAQKSMADEDALDAVGDLLRSASVVVTIGPGGVGKTTLAAAMGARAAAEYGRRVLVITIDPARRLAEALGIEKMRAEPVLIPVGEGDGRLWVSMVDMAMSWDRLVHDLAPDANSADALMANPLYRSLTRRFIQSHDYIALDHLADAADDDRYDLVIIDTPPSGHAIDVLDAPDRMIEFFDSRFLRWMTASNRSRMARATARPFLAVAERLLGGRFLAQISEFFWLFLQLQPGFVRRAGAVKARLRADGTTFVLVTVAEQRVVEQTVSLLDDLSDRGLDPALILNNRATPGEPLPSVETVDEIVDEELRVAVMALLDRNGTVVAEALKAPIRLGTAAGPADAGDRRRRLDSG